MAITKKKFEKPSTLIMRRKPMIQLQAHIKKYLY